MMLRFVPHTWLASRLFAALLVAACLPTAAHAAPAEVHGSGDVFAGRASRLPGASCAGHGRGEHAGRRARARPTRAVSAAIAVVGVDPFTQEGTKSPRAGALDGSSSPCAMPRARSPIFRSTELRFFARRLRRRQATPRWWCSTTACPTPTPEFARRGRSRPTWHRACPCATRTAIAMTTRASSRACSTTRC